MSGTSLDGVDGALMDLSGDGHKLLAHAWRPLPDAVRAGLLALNASGADELHQAAQSANELVQVYAAVVEMLRRSGNAQARDIIAIGAHGQTVRHCPPSRASAGSSTSPYTCKSTIRLFWQNSPESTS